MKATPNRQLAISEELHSGAGTALFTTSCEPARSDMFLGEQTGLFTTSCAPQTQDKVLVQADIKVA